MGLRMLHRHLQAALDQMTVIAREFVHSAPAAAKYAELGVGRHIRHVTDHVQSLVDGAQIGTIDFNFRTRDSDTERNPHHALSLIEQQQRRLDQLATRDFEQAITVISEMSFDQSLSRGFQSTLAREVLYLINHTIHHAAYVKVMLQQHQVFLPAEIGLAPCTMSYERQKRAACVALAS